LSADTQLIVFDSSRVGIAPLRVDNPMYAIYSAQFMSAMELARGAAHNFFIDHHPILGFATDTGKRPAGVYPGNAALQSVLTARTGRRCFPSASMRCCPGTTTCSRRSASRPGNRRNSLPATAAPGWTNRCRARCRPMQDPPPVPLSRR